MLNINGGLIEVFDFGSGPFTGPLNLDIIVASKSDYVNLGLRVDDGTNSYIMPIYANLLDADLAYQRKPISIGYSPEKKESSDKEEEKNYVTITESEEEKKRQAKETADRRTSGMFTRKQK